MKNFLVTTLSRVRRRYCGLWGQLPRQGFGLVEIVVATAVISVTLIGFLQAEIVALRLLRREKENLETTLLAEEALEAVRAVRDETWSNISSLANSTRYYPTVVGNKWQLSATPQGLFNGKYNRFVILDPVYRDVQDRIASTGTLDTGTRRVRAYATTTAKQTELVTYITNFPETLSGPPSDSATFWIGLQNSDDTGTNFDMKAEIAKNGSLVAQGEAKYITGVNRNPDFAKEVTVFIVGLADDIFVTGDAVTMRVLTKVADLGGHGSAVGVRFYYDAVNRAARMSVPLRPASRMDYFLHSSVLSGDFMNTTAPTSTTAKYKDSPGVERTTYKEIGTWSYTYP